MHILSRSRDDDIDSSRLSNKVLGVGIFNEDVVKLVPVAGRLLVPAETQLFSGPKKMLSLLPIFILFRL